MAAPTEAEIQAQIGAVVDLLEELRNFGHVNAKNWVALENSIVTQQEGDFAAEVLGAVAASRASFNESMTSDTAAAILTPLILQYAKLLDISTVELSVVFSELRRDFVAGAKTILSRDFSYGVPTPGTNVGDGAVYRLNVDKYGHFLENTHADAKGARCVADEFSGRQRHEEGFAIFGGASERDQIQITGSGRTEAIDARSARSSESYIQNPSFEQYVLETEGDLTTPVEISGWTVAGGGSPLANVDLDVDAYRGYPGVDDADLVAVKLLADETLSQGLDVLDAVIDPTIPMFLQVAFKRLNGCDGTLTVRLGSQSVAVVLSTQTGWTTVQLGIDKENYYDVFNQDGLAVSLELSGRTAGELLLDDVIFVPFTPFDGGWFVAVGGATPFRRDDEFTMPDTEVGAKIQRWLWRAFGEYLPSSLTPTWADPA